MGRVFLPMKEKGSCEKTFPKDSGKIFFPKSIHVTKNVLALIEIIYL